MTAPINTGLTKCEHGIIKKMCAKCARTEQALAAPTLLSADELRRRADLLEASGDALVTLAASGWAKGGAKWARIRLREMATAERRRSGTRV